MGTWGQNVKPIPAADIVVTVLGRPTAPKGKMRHVPPPHRPSGPDSAGDICGNPRGRNDAPPVRATGVKAFPREGQTFPGLAGGQLRQGRALSRPSAHPDGIGTMNVFTATYTNYGCGDFSRNALPTCCSGYGKKDPTSRTYIYKVARGVKETPIRRKTIEETENSRTPPIIHAANEGEEEDYAVNIAPRNLQKMKVKAGQKFTKVHIRDKILRRPQDRGRRRNHGGQVQTCC